jgi:hypothetical protein
VGCLLGCCGGSDVLAEYAPDPIYEDVTITKPLETDVWLAGSPHTVTCEFEDQDCNLDTGELEDDDVICTWSGSSGTFKNGNVGLSVEYVCIDEEGTDWVEVSATDAGVLAPDYWESAYDYVAFTTIVPAIDYVYFAGNYVLCDVSDAEWLAGRLGQDAKSEPFVYKRSTSALVMRATIKAWHETNLTEGTEVKVQGSATFDRHDPFEMGTDSTGATFGTSWPSATSEWLRNQSQLWDTVEKTSGCIAWQYRVPDGSNTWISLGSSDHGAAGDEKLVTVWDLRKCDYSDYTKEHVLDSAGYAQSAELSNTEPNVAENVCRNVAGSVYGGCICPGNGNGKAFAYHMAACKNDFPPGTPPNDKGACCCRAYGMICVLKVLGVGTYVQDFVNEHPEPNTGRAAVTAHSSCKYYYRMGGAVYCPHPDCDDSRLRRASGGGGWNNWQGVCKKGNGEVCYSPQGPHIGVYEQIDNAPSYTTSAPDSHDDETHYFGYYAWNDWSDNETPQDGSEVRTTVTSAVPAWCKEFPVADVSGFVADDVIIIQLADGSFHDREVVASVDAENHTITIASRVGNAHVTPVGSVIRKGHLQEPDDEASR